MRHIWILAAVVAFSAFLTSASANPLARDSANPLARDPWAGTFTGDGLSVVLAGAGGNYAGTITLGGQTFPAKATATGQKLAGAFQFGGKDFDFSIELAGDSATLTSGGKTYALKRQQAAAPVENRQPADVNPPADANAKALVGDWIFGDGTTTVEVILSADGEFSRTVATAQGTERARGRYAVKGTKLEIRPEGGGELLVMDYAVDGDQLTLKNEDGSGIRMERRKQAEGGNQSTNKPQVNANAPTVVFRRAWEPNEKAFTILVPAGWKTEGGIFNVNPLMANGEGNTMFPKCDFAVKKDDVGSVMIRFLPSYNYADLTVSKQVVFQPQPGTQYRGMVVKLMPSTADFLQEMFQFVRPRATSPKVVAAGQLPDVVKHYAARFAANDAQMRQLGLRGPSADAAVIEIEYTEGGTKYREAISTVLIDNRDAGFVWTNEYTIAVRAPADEMEAWGPVLMVIRKSLTTNPEWAMRVSKAGADRIKAAMETQRYIQRVSEQIVESKREVTSGIARQGYLYMTNQADYDNPFGGQQVDRDTNQYAHRWVTKDGDVALTNDPSYDPNKDPNQKMTEWRKSKVRDW